MHAFFCQKRLDLRQEAFPHGHDHKVLICQIYLRKLFYRTSADDLGTSVLFRYKETCQTDIALGKDLAGKTSAAPPTRVKRNLLLDAAKGGGVLVCGLLLGLLLSLLLR